MKANGGIRVQSRAFLASTLEAAQLKLHRKHPRRPVESADGPYGPSGHSGDKKKNSALVGLEFRLLGREPVA